MPSVPEDDKVALGAGVMLLLVDAVEVGGTVMVSLAEGGTVTVTQIVSFVPVQLPDTARRPAGHVLHLSH